MPHDKEKIALLVKNARLAKGYTQMELSQLTRISLRSIQRVENGEVLPRLYTLKILAGQLNFELDEALPAIQNTDTTLDNEAPDVLRNTGNGVRLSSPRKIILTAGLGLLFLLLPGAYLLQSAHFPETTFEGVLFWAVVCAIYTAVVFRIWK